ncbi:hypothetical protein Tco_0977824, partial [Tanacetum coccineum]
FVMSDLEDSTVTYTKVSSPFKDLSDIGSSGVIVHGYDGQPIMPEDPYVEAALQAPPSLDYVPGPEEPKQAPPSPVYVPYVPKPVYPEFMSPKDDSPGYITESNPEEDDEDPEEDPTDYPTDRDDDKEEEESFRDNANDKEKDEEEEEEHLAPADSVPSPAYRTTARMSIRLFATFLLAGYHGWESEFLYSGYKAKR